MVKNKNKTKKIDVREKIDLKKQIKKIDIGIHDGVFVFTKPLSVSEFAQKINKSVQEILKYFFMQKKMYSINTILSEEDIGNICLEFNLDFEKKVQIDETNVLENLEIKDDERSLTTRCPVVTIMGHVDHGKTTLLDTIRRSKIVDSESGGITQHIGAYQITWNKQPITFIDTPGHEAFTKMRARGANLTDIVVLVVAGDDGLKPQTIEAISHAKAAKTPIIVFVNKMDKPAASYDKVVSELNPYDLIPEEWGGSTIIVKGSALKNEGIEQLLDSILLTAQIMDLKANQNRDGMGVTIEASMSKGLGPTATLLVKNGSVYKGDFITFGQTYGRIRNMFNDLGKEIDKAIPGQPVKITGLEEIPSAGSHWIVCKDESMVKNIAKKTKNKDKFLVSSHMNSSADEQENDLKKLNLIIKSDVHGSLEAIKYMFDQIEIENAKIVLIHSAIGEVTETDVQLAKASHASIICFNIRPNKIVRDLAQEQNIAIQCYNVIYKLKEDLIKMLYSSLDDVICQEEFGEAKVLQTWHFSKIGTIAGCLVTSGKVKRNARVRVVRDGKEIYDSVISSLQHEKTPISETTVGKECGIVVANYNDLKVGDILQIYEEKAKTALEIHEEKNDLKK